MRMTPPQTKICMWAGGAAFSMGWGHHGMGGWGGGWGPAQSAGGALRAHQKIAPKWPSKWLSVGIEPRTYGLEVTGLKKAHFTDTKIFEPAAFDIPLGYTTTRLYVFVTALRECAYTVQSFAAVFQVSYRFPIFHHGCHHPNPAFAWLGWTLHLGYWTLFGF